MADWVNGWTVSYFIACGVVIAAVWLQRDRLSGVRWLRVGAWLAAAAVLGTVVWSVLGCLWLRLVEHRQMVIRTWDPVACVSGSSGWAGFVVAALLPLYGLLLTWYTQRYGPSEPGRTVMAARMLWLSLPGALWVAYAYAFPVHDLGQSMREGSAYGAIALASCWLALTAPRVTIRRLGAGSLWGRVAA